MKPKVRSQQNSETLPSYVRIDEEVHVSTMELSPESIEVVMPSPKEHTGRSCIKKENFKLASGVYSPISPNAGFKTDTGFYSNSSPTAKRHTNRSKNYASCGAVVKKENGDTKKLDEPCFSISRCQQHGDDGCVTFSDGFLPKAGVASNSGYSSCLSKKQFQHSVSQEVVPLSSSDKKTVVSCASGCISSKFSNPSMLKNVKFDRACSNAFYSMQTDKLQVNEADIPPFTPSEEIGCSDIIDIAQMSCMKTRQGLNNKPVCEKTTVRRTTMKHKQLLKNKNAAKVGKASKNRVVPARICNPASVTKKGREIDQLYKNLQEISWANDKDFKTLLCAKGTDRHSGRLSSIKAVTADRSRKMGQSQKATDSSRPKKVSKKTVVTNQNHSSIVKPKPRSNISALMKKKLKKSAQIALAKKPVSTTGVRKPGSSSRSKNTTHPKQFLAKVKKEKPDSYPEPAETKKRNKAASEVSSAGIMEKLSKKALENHQPAKVRSDVAPSNAGPKVDASFQECSLWKNMFKEARENSILSALQKGQELRVTLQPLEKADFWFSDCETVSNVQKECETYTRSSLQERMLKVFAGVDQRNISSVLREVHDSRSTSSSAKNSKKRKYEEESVRSSVRQSECAFRYKEIVVKKHEHYIQVVLVPNSNKQNSLTIEAMKELKEAFQSARKDTNCKAVLLNSSGSFFCSGIDMSQLCGSGRKHAAEEMAVTIRDLILTFAIFPKPVVAAVNGCSIGLGVALLTFCDIVLASDKATFGIPSAQFGYIPEGGVTLTLPQVVGSTVAMEMLLQGRRLTAQQALKYGLVSEVIWPTQLMEEVVPRMQSLVKQPLQVMEATKTMVRCHLWEKLAVQLNHEWRILPSQWLSNVCQQKMRHHLQNGWQVD